LPVVDARDPVRIPITYSDIDVNRHVNNSRYVGMLLDSYPLSFHFMHTLSALEINFLGETVNGDTLLLASTQTGPAEFHHDMRKELGRAEVCRARLQWNVLDA
jgi:medium-chain acyl-[acyl-carrier-protein] hydrolase